MLSPEIHGPPSLSGGPRAGRTVDKAASVPRVVLALEGWEAQLPEIGGGKAQEELPTKQARELLQGEWSRATPWVTSLPPSCHSDGPLQDHGLTSLNALSL